MTKPIMGPAIIKEGKYSQDLCIKLIEDGKLGYSFEAFASVAGVTKQTLHNWVKEHPEFALAKAIGLEHCRRYWEDSGRKGQYLGKDFNATVWIFNMKNRFHWIDKIDQNINANLNVEKLSDEELRKLTEEAIKFLKDTKPNESNNTGLQ